MKSVRYAALYAGLLGSVGVSAANLPDLGTASGPVAKADAETCHRLQQDFDIDLKQVVKAGCEPPTDRSTEIRRWVVAERAI